MTVRERIQSHGIHRSGGPRRGFRYHRAGGAPVSAAQLARIVALKIPPRWTKVAIARSTGEAVQAVGRDAAGRWQYLYHPRHAARRARGKYERLLAFGHALPALRRALASDLRLPGLPRDKALACAVAIMATCFLRAGSEEYAEEHGTFGLATLRRRHVTVRGDRIRFEYRGKHGQRQEHDIANRRLARIVARMLRIPGPRAFKYRDEDDKSCDVSRWQLNQYVKRVMGRRFSARDFRTWAGTWVCAGELARRSRSASGRAARQRVIKDALRETAAHLGNTERVCRSSYVHPRVLRAFESGETVSCELPLPEEVLARHGKGLDRPEHALLELLERASRRTKR